MRASYLYVFALLVATACSSPKTTADARTKLSPESYYTYAAQDTVQHCTERLTMSGGISVKCN